MLVCIALVTGSLTAIANAHNPMRLFGVDCLGDLPLFGLSLSWSLLTVLMETSHWARESTKVEVDEAQNPLAWIESGPLRDIMPLAVGIPVPPPNDRIARP